MRELPRALRQRVLRQHVLPPQHEGLHDPRRRSHRHGAGRRVHLGRQVPRRDPRHAQAHQPRRHVHGQLRPQHQRLAVLLHVRQVPAPQRQEHGVWESHRRVHGAGHDGENPGGRGGQAARGDTDQPRHDTRQPPGISAGRGGGYSR